MRRFSAGCQPRHPHGSLIVGEFEVPGADSPYLPGAGSISSRISKRLGALPAQAQYSFYVPPHGARLGHYFLKQRPSKQLSYKRSQIYQALNTSLGYQWSSTIANDCQLHALLANNARLMLCDIIKLNKYQASNPKEPTC